MAYSLYAYGSLYVACDQLVQDGRYPFIDLHGCALLFTEYETACRAVSVYEQKRLGKLTIKKLEPDEYTGFFNTLQKFATFVRVEHDGKSDDLSVVFLTSNDSSDLVDWMDDSLRSICLRVMEIDALLKEDPVEQAASEYKAIARWMPALRRSGYHQMGKSLFYVYAPRNGRSDDINYATPAAREYAVKRFSGNPARFLQTPDTKGVESYQDQLTLRVINRPGETEVSKGLLCAFTSRKAALECLEDFRSHGCDDVPVVITFDELMNQARECQGIMLDLKGLRTVFPCSHYDEMMRCAALEDSAVLEMINSVKPLIPPVVKV